MKTPEELSELFRARGLKITPQRLRIFAVLHDNEAHPSAEAVHAVVRRDMPSVSLKTVYQTLHDLASMGEIQLLDLGTGATRFDPNVARHHHLVCTSCGKVRDVEADLPVLALPHTELQGFTVGDAEVVFRGLCDACTTPGTTATSSPTQTHGRKAHA